MNRLYQRKLSAEPMLGVGFSGPISKIQLERIQTGLPGIDNLPGSEPFPGFTLGLTGVPNDGGESSKVENSPAA